MNIEIKVVREGLVELHVGEDLDFYEVYDHFYYECKRGSVAPISEEDILIIYAYTIEELLTLLRNYNEVNKTNITFTLV